MLLFLAYLLQRSILLMEFLGSYLAELSLLDYGCLRFLPSIVAASVMFVARLTINPDVNPWVSNKIDLLDVWNITQWIFLFLKAHYPAFFLCILEQEVTEGDGLQGFWTQGLHRIHTWLAAQQEVFIIDGNSWQVQATQGMHIF